MVVKRIVCDIAAKDVGEVRRFYEDLLGLTPVMDQGWIVTLSAGAAAPAQVSIMTKGGSGAPVPDMSIEVDDVDDIHARARAQGAPIVYDLTDEPWGVRRFFLRDPAGKVLNILTHTG